MVDRTRLYGQEVTVVGEVTDVHEDRAFVLRTGLGEEGVLVMTRSPIRLADTEVLDRGDHIRVTGTVRQFEAAQIQQETGWQADQRIETEYRGRPVIVVESIGFFREVGEWRETTGYAPGTDEQDRDRRLGEPGQPTGQLGQPGQPGQAQAFQGGSEQIVLIVTAVQTEELSGRQVTLQNVPVRQVVSERAFWIGDSPAQQLLVVVEQEKLQDMDVSAGQRVTIRGTVQRMPEADQITQQWGVSPQMRDTVANQRVYVRAESVERMQS